MSQKMIVSRNTRWQAWGCRMASVVVGMGLMAITVGGCTKWGGGKTAGDESAEVPANIETRLEAFEENLKSIQETVEKQGELLASLEKQLNEKSDKSESSAEHSGNDEDLKKFKDALLDMDDDLQKMQDEIDSLKEKQATGDGIQQDLDY